MFTREIFRYASESAEISGNGPGFGKAEILELN
jgi:hypothetical protein